MDAKQCVEAWGSVEFNGRLLEFLSEHWCERDFGDDLRLSGYCDDFYFESVIEAHAAAKTIKARVLFSYTDVQPTSCCDVGLASNRTGILCVALHQSDPFYCEVNVYDVSSQEGGDYY